MVRDSEKGTRTKSVVGEMFKTSSREVQQQNVVVYLKPGLEMLKLRFALVYYMGQGYNNNNNNNHCFDAARWLDFAISYLSLACAQRYRKGDPNKMLLCTSNRIGKG